jgi:acetyl-CoA carboxylase biotin carboxylase subunit
MSFAFDMQRALDETVIGGVPTTIGYHQLILATEDFVKGEVDTGFITTHAEGEQCEHWH